METTNAKVAICTGAGRGLGRAMALGLERSGYLVAITAAVNKAEIDAVAKEASSGNIFPFLADVSNMESCASLVSEVEAKLGPVGILVNNAGRGMRYVSETFLSRPTNFWEIDPDTWRLIIDTNVNGPFYMASAVVPNMIKRGWGRVINISMNHETMRRRGFSPYGPSKAALESETVIWAQELEGTGVTVNALLPGGASLTGMIPEGIAEDMKKKLIDPEIMVPPLLWLASEGSNECTGRRINARLWDRSLEPLKAMQAASEIAGWMPS